MLWKELFAVGVSCVGGGAPGDEDLHNGVAAQTVAAMDAAGDLPADGLLLGGLFRGLSAAGFLGRGFLL